MHHEIGIVLRNKELVRTEWRLKIADCDRLAADTLARAEMPALVIFAVVGKENLGHDAEQATALHRHGAIVDAAAVSERRSEEGESAQRRRFLDDPRDRLHHAVEQRVLQQEIIDRVGRERELGEHQNGHAALVARSQHPQDRRGIGGGVSDRDACSAGGNAREAMAIDGVELHLFGQLMKAGMRLADAPSCCECRKWRSQPVEIIATGSRHGLRLGQQARDNTYNDKTIPPGEVIR